MELETFLTISFGFVCAIAGVAIGVKANNKQQTQERTLIMAKLSVAIEQLKAQAEEAEKIRELSTKTLGEVKLLREDFQKLKESVEDVELPADAQEAIDNISIRLVGIKTNLTEADAVNPDAEASGQ